MKARTLILGLITFVAMNSIAATLTVDNNESSAAQYSDLQAAVDAAQIGDTILVAASPTGYGNVYISKRLYLKGGGHLGLRSYLSYCYLNNLNSESGADNSVITGFEINTLRFDGTYPNIPSGARGNLEGIIVERNKINGMDFIQSHDYSNFIVRNNLFTNGIGFAPNNYSVKSSFSNMQIANNIFNGGYISSDVDLSSSNGVPYVDGYQTVSGNYFRNNLFIGMNYVFNSIIGAVVENNIFYSVNIIPESNYTNLDTLRYNFTFNNNITYLTPQDITENSWFAVGSNNIDANPLFVDFPVEGGDFSLSHDYHLQEESPALGAGVGGVDLGIYGGTYPWPANLDTKPKGPKITKVEPVGSPSVPAGGTIQIQFQSTIEE